MNAKTSHVEVTLQCLLGCATASSTGALIELQPPNSDQSSDSAWYRLRGCCYAMNSDAMNQRASLQCFLRGSRGRKSMDVMIVVWEIIMVAWLMMEVLVLTLVLMVVLMVVLVLMVVRMVVLF